MTKRCSSLFAFGPALLLLIALSAVTPAMGEEQVPTRAAAGLRTLVENLYGKKVRIEEVRNGNPDYCGEASVTPDGTPIVKVNIDIESKDLVIVHELLHLKLRKDGYPRYFVTCPADLSLNYEALSDIRRMANEMRDLIEHFSFLFPQMEEMGLNPYGTMRAIYTRNLQSGYVDTFQDPVYQTFNYMKIALESNDTRIVADLERHYIENNWERSLKRGRELVRIVRNTQPGIPAEAAALTVTCLNQLFKDDLDFRIARWRVQGRGSHTEHVVEVVIRPAE